MSADLFAAFGAPQQTPPNETRQALSGNEATPSSDQPAANGTEPWILQSRPIPRHSEREPQSSLWTQDHDGTDVLFDASDPHANDEDFGDFEDAPVEAGSLTDITGSDPRDHNADLLGLGDSHDDSNMILNGNTSLSNAAKPYGLETDLFTTEDAVLSASNKAAPPLPAETSSGGRMSDIHDIQHTEALPRQHHKSVDDDWGAFESVQPNQVQLQNRPNSNLPSIPTTQETAKQEEDVEDWDTFDETSFDHAPAAQGPPVSSTTISPSMTTQTSDLKQRPTNIPPPSTLLQMLPHVYNTLSTQSRTATPHADLASHILQAYKTTARILSGRSHRWKRDTILSQSTRISVAGVRTSGMKLTALDKGESIKEDQEAAEVIAAWQRHAATLNAVMLKAKVQKPPMSLSINIKIKASSDLGVLTSRECCAVCGLKRNERVLGIDVKVEDVFEEFWVEHWGHRDCADFWYSYQRLLNKR